MNELVIDTNATVKRFIKVGFNEVQAEELTATITELAIEKLATKKDLKETETALRKDLKEIEYRLIIKLGVMLVATIGILATLIKLL